MSHTSINGRKKCLTSLDKIRIIKIIVSLNIIFFGGGGLRESLCKIKRGKFFSIKEFKKNVI